jgi:hypothetical protein
MFDGDDFFKSEQYFTILQALRLCRNYVNDIIRDVRNIPNKMHDELDPMLEGLAENHLAEKLLELQRLDTILSRLVSDCEALFEPLLDRIERINEEMKSLRDGVSFLLLFAYFTDLNSDWSMIIHMHMAAAIQCHVCSRSIQGNQFGREQCSAEPLYSRIHYSYHFYLPMGFVTVRSQPI